MTVPLKGRRRAVVEVLNLALADEEERLAPDDQELLGQIVALAEQRRRGHVTPEVSNLVKRRERFDEVPTEYRALLLVGYAMDCLAMVVQFDSPRVTAGLRELREALVKRGSRGTAVAPPPPPGGFMPRMPPATDVPD